MALLSKLPTQGLTWCDPHERPVRRPMRQFYPLRSEQFHSDTMLKDNFLLWHGKLSISYESSVEPVIVRDVWLTCPALVGEKVRDFSCSLVLVKGAKTRGHECKKKRSDEAYQACSVDNHSVCS